MLFFDIEKSNKLPDSMGLSIITLLFKKGERTQIGNYRPISLLNSDYKILAKILANRLKRVIGTVVNVNQAYGIPGRDIADTILSLQYFIDKMCKTSGVLISLDFNKAFDRVEHEFLWSVLTKFGFGDRFINWLRLLYSSAVFQ